MFTGRTGIDPPTVPILQLQIGELIIGPLHQRPVGKAHQIRLQLGVEQFDQEGSADDVNRQIAMFGRSPLDVHAIAMAADMDANDASSERLQQHLA